MFPDLFMLFAIIAGTVPAHPPIAHAPRMAQHRAVHPATKVSLTHAVPLPRTRPTVAALPSATVVKVPQWLDPDPYPFKWTGRYDLPPKWVQIWKFIG